MVNERVWGGAAAPPDSATVTWITACWACLVGGRVAMNSRDFVWPACSDWIGSVDAGNCSMIDWVPVREADTFSTERVPALTTSTRTRTCSPPSKIKLLFSSRSMALNRRTDDPEGVPTFPTGLWFCSCEAVGSCPPAASLAFRETRVAKSMTASRIKGSII